MRLSALSASTALAALAAIALPAAPAEAQYYYYHQPAPTYYVPAPAQYWPTYGYAQTYAVPAQTYAVPAPAYGYGHAPSWPVARAGATVAAPAASYPAWSGSPWPAWGSSFSSWAEFDRFFDDFWRTGGTRSAAWPTAGAGAMPRARTSVGAGAFPAWSSFGAWPDWGSFGSWSDFDSFFDGFWDDEPLMMSSAWPTAGAGMTRRSAPRARTAVGAGAPAMLGFDDFDSESWGDGGAWAGGSAASYSYVHTVNYGDGRCARTMRATRAANGSTPRTVTHNDNACTSNAPVAAGY